MWKMLQNKLAVDLHLQNVFLSFDTKSRWLAVSLVGSELCCLSMSGICQSSNLGIGWIKQGGLDSVNISGRLTCGG